MQVFFFLLQISGRSIGHHLSQKSKINLQESRHSASPRTIYFSSHQSPSAIVDQDFRTASHIEKHCTKNFIMSGSSSSGSPGATTGNSAASNTRSHVTSSTPTNIPTIRLSSKKPVQQANPRCACPCGCRRICRRTDIDMCDYCIEFHLGE